MLTYEMKEAVTLLRRASNDPRLTRGGDFLAMVGSLCEVVASEVERLADREDVLEGMLHSANDGDSSS